MGEPSGCLGTPPLMISALFGEAVGLPDTLARRGLGSAQVGTPQSVRCAQSPTPDSAADRARGHAESRLVEDLRHPAAYGLLPQSRRIAEE